MFVWCIELRGLLIFDAHNFGTPKMGEKIFNKKNQMINIIALKPKNERNCPTIVIPDRRQLHVAFGRSPRQGDWSPLGRKKNAGRLADTTSTPRDGVKSTAAASFVVAVSRYQQLQRSENRSWEHGTTERPLFHLRLHQRFADEIST